MSASEPLISAGELFRDTRCRFRPVPFEGSDWLLRAIQCEGVGVEFVCTPEPLAVYRCEETRARIGNSRNWREALTWANDEATCRTPRARAGLILNRVSFEAKRAGNARAFWSLAREAFRRGRPTMMDLLAHTIIWLLPLKARFSIAAFVRRRFPSHNSTDPRPHRAPINTL